MEEKAIIRCPKCQQKFRIPVNKGAIVATCPGCKIQLRFDTNDIGAKLAKYEAEKAQQTVDRPKSKTASDPSRYVYLSKPKHAYRGFNFTGYSNWLVDTRSSPILLDGNAVGSMRGDGELTIPMDEKEHTLTADNRLFKRHCKVPAGRENYIGICFNHGKGDNLYLHPENDPFYSQVAAYMLNVFKGQGIRDRIQSTQNRHHGVEIAANADGIEISYLLSNVNGWGDPKSREMIYYRDMGLYPMPESQLPGGYYETIQNRLIDDIADDREVDMEYTTYGFAPRKMHSL